MAKTDDYIVGRSKGYEIAWRLLQIQKQQFKDQNKTFCIEREIHFREQTGFQYDANVFDLEEAAKEVITLSQQTQCLMHLYILRVAFFFGKKRIAIAEQKFIEASNVLINNGLHRWMDFIQEIKRDHNIEIDFDICKPRTKRTRYEDGVLSGLKIARDHAASGKDIAELLRYRPIRRLNDNQAKLMTKEIEDNVTYLVEWTFATFCALINHEMYGFGEIRGQRYTDRKDLALNCMADGYVHWYDILEFMAEEVGLDESKYQLVRNENWDLLAIGEEAKERLKHRKEIA